MLTSIVRNPTNACCDNAVFSCFCCQMPPGIFQCYVWWASRVRPLVRPLDRANGGNTESGVVIACCQSHGFLCAVVFVIALVMRCSSSGHNRLCCMPLNIYNPVKRETLRKHEEHIYCLWFQPQRCFVFFSYFYCVSSSVKADSVQGVVFRILQPNKQLNTGGNMRLRPSQAFPSNVSGVFISFLMCSKQANN